MNIRFVSDSDGQLVAVVTFPERVLALGATLTGRTPEGLVRRAADELLTRLRYSAREGFIDSGRGVVALSVTDELLS